MDWNEERKGFRSAGDITAYQAAFRFSQEVNRFSLQIYESGQGRPEIDRLHRNTNLLTAKIAAGHVIGYSRESLEKNIALCREASSVCEECSQLLKRLPEQDKYVLEIVSLKDSLNETTQELEQWIKHLEKLVWW